jgi:hypothetical protein
MASVLEIVEVMKIKFEARIQAGARRKLQGADAVSQMWMAGM